jgi:hypothetical protein
VREHLRPGGCFAFNIFHPSLGIMAQNTGPMAGVWRWTQTYDRPSGGCVVRSEANYYDTVGQRVFSQHRYDEYAPGGSLTRAFLHRLELAYLYPSDVRRLLAASGFQRVHIAGGFDGREPQRDTDELVIEAWVDRVSGS